ncbi:MAG: response regulator [Hylemonella sp.]|nr:response regulator [Hylemonella sp.]
MDSNGLPQSGTPGANPAHSQASPDGGLKLLVKGFSATEHKLLLGVVFLSRRRAPRIDLLEPRQAREADVIMIDTHDQDAMQWARQQPYLHEKAVIWVDGHTAHPGHTLAKRPIQWPVLPVLLYHALERRPQNVSEQAAQQHNNRRILIIDDSLPVRTHIRQLLEPRGFSVTEAESAAEGIAVDAKTSFACVLMDVMMPGIDGYEACRRVKANHPGGQAPAVVMLTSKSSPFDRIRGKMAGCDDYLTKPVDAEHLHTVLSHYVRAETQASSPMSSLGLKPAF